MDFYNKMKIRFFYQLVDQRNFDNFEIKYNFFLIKKTQKRNKDYEDIL